nr:integrase, catalytic region, zinc finger, CCHC-type, peptidase aspartic, catalytic [Tanacetum cinerariifolium]
MWKPKSPKGNVNPNLIEIVLFIVDSRCSKHMMGNLKLLINFVEKFLGTGNDLLTGSRGTDLYSITLQSSSSPNPICLMAKATSSQAWLWHRRLSHLNFDTINLLSKNDIVEKGNECIFVGYPTQSRAYRVFNKRTRVIMESIHVNFDELPQMVLAHNSSDPAPTCQTMASVQISSDPAPKCQTMALEQGSLSPGRKC